MWRGPRDELEEYVLRQDPRAKDAWVIISSLTWLLDGCNWYKAGLSKEQLAQELRRNSYKTGQSQDQQWSKVIESFVSYSTPVVGDVPQGIVPGLSAPGLVVAGRTRRRTGTRILRTNDMAARREMLLQEIMEYENRCRVAASKYWKALRKTGLPKLVIERVMKFLELRVDDITGPRMYCMRCRDYWNLSALIDHFCNNLMHIAAVAAQSA
jgi:hypothetical protein